MLQTARMLVLSTLLYNVVEGVIALWASYQAGSLALAAFGADSYVEVAAAAVVLWRLGVSDPERGEEIERRALKFIGWTFLILAAAIVFQSSWALVTSNDANESLVGILLALASVTLMPTLALMKLRTAARGGIRALAAEAKETLACSYLSVTLLIGLVANAAFGWWWLDAVTALLLTPWLIREGLEGVRGEHEDEEAPLCFCRGCLFGLRTCNLACCVAA